MESLAHILVVDDHREIRNLLAKYLAKHGFRVSAAESAAKVRRLLEASGGVGSCPAPAGEHAPAGHDAYPQGRGPGIALATRPRAECAGLQLHQGRTVLTEPREGCFYREIGKRWPVMSSTHAGTA